MKANALQGSLTKNIFIFAIPLMLSSILQNFFNVADKAVLGHMAGEVAVASIAATTTIAALVINGAVGLASGTSIVLARFIGQGDKQKIRATIDTALLSSIFIGLLVAVAGFFLTPVFLKATKCPEECYEGAVIYMRIVLAAAPATLLYNYGSAILRTLGDSQKTLLYITIAGAVNVVLNVILCLVLTQKVVAVAVATAVSNLISGLLIVRRIFYVEGREKKDQLRFRFSLSSLGKIVRFGIPSSISSLVLPLGNVQITTAINTYGAAAVAGHSAALSVEMVAYAASGGMSSAAMTFMGQNIGAKNVARVRKTFWLCLLYNFLIAGSLGVLTYWTGEFWLGLVLGNPTADAVSYGMIRLFHVLQFMFVYAISNVLTASLNAFGYPIFTSITNIIFNLGFRVFWMQVVYPRSQTFATIMLCYIVAWLLNLSFYIIAFAFVYRRYIKTGICKKI